MILKTVPSSRIALAVCFQLGVLVLLSGCFAGVSVKPVASLERLQTPRAGSAVADLSPAARQMLRLLGLRKLYDVRPDTVVLALDRMQRDTMQHGLAHGGLGDPALLATIAELALHAARRHEALDPEAAAGWYLAAAERAWTYLFTTPVSAMQAFDPAFQRLRHVYAQAVTGYVMGLAQWGGGLRPHSRTALEETFEVGVDHGEGLWAPGYFDDFLPAEAIAIQGVRNRYARSGLGAALVAVRENRGLSALEQHLPPQGIIYPATAVLRFDVDVFDPESGTFDVDNRNRAATLVLHNPWQSTRTVVAGQEVPLAVDFSAPYALLLDRAKLPRLAMAGLLRAEKTLFHQGLFLLEPYDPQRIPVVMVHGLRSSPHAWIELTNDLHGDPELRNRFQVWHYMYPTALPYLYSSNELRRSLAQVRRRLDPEDRHPASRSMVIVAHSMGGLLAKPLVSSSGTKVWDAILTVSPESIRGRPDYVDQVRDVFLFEPLPYIDRVIFISTPHRGSAMAGGFVGKLSSALVRLPEGYKDLMGHLFERNPEAMHPEMRELMARGGPTSIRALSPRHPLLKALAKLPIDDDVVYHTILGNRGQMAADSREISDGFVTYTSAHLEGARSELLVPAKHAAYDHPLTIKEVKRILREHLEELDWAELLEQIHEDPGRSLEDPRGATPGNAGQSP